MVRAANVTALEEMDRKLKRSDEELDLVNKWLDEAEGKLLSKYIVNTTGHLRSGFYAEHMVFGECNCHRRGRGPQGGAKEG